MTIAKLVQNSFLTSALLNFVAGTARILLHNCEQTAWVIKDVVWCQTPMSMLWNDYTKSEHIAKAVQYNYLVLISRLNCQSD